MGVQLDIWRARIGAFSQPIKCRSSIHGIVLTKHTISLTLRLCMFLSLVICGDVEANPGPPKQVSGSNGSSTQTSHSQPSSQNKTSNRPTTRQQRLSFAQAVTSPGQRDLSPKRSYEHSSQNSSNSNNAEVLAYLHDMRSEVRTDFAKINEKIDDVNVSVNQLKKENEDLKAENHTLWKEISAMKTKMDKLEAQSRRNNLKFKGIPGYFNEKWSDTENKVRAFIKDNLNRPDLENVQIDRAHRLKTKYNDKCDVIVKFANYKDKDDILSTAKQMLKSTPYMVHEDFTERVMTHRRELGKRLVSEREAGNYATMSYDKLIVNDMVYGYDDNTQTIYTIGRSRSRQGARSAEDRPADTNESVRRENGDQRAHGVRRLLATDNSQRHDVS